MAWKVGDRVHCQLVICRGYIRVSKSSFCDWQFYGKIDVKLRYITLFSFAVWFESVVNGFGGQNL